MPAALQPSLNLLADVPGSEQSLRADGISRGAFEGPWRSGRSHQPECALVGEVAHAAWDAEAELKRTHRLPRARREVDENKACRPGPEHDVIQVHIGMDVVIRVKHPQGCTHISEQLWQVLLRQELERQSAKARHKAPIPS